MPVLCCLSLPSGYSIRSLFLFMIEHYQKSGRNSFKQWKTPNHRWLLTICDKHDSNLVEMKRVIVFDILPYCLVDLNNEQSFSFFATNVLCIYWNRKVDHHWWYSVASVAHTFVAHRLKNRISSGEESLWFVHPWKWFPYFYVSEATLSFLQKKNNIPPKKIPLIYYTKKIFFVFRKKLLYEKKARLIKSIKGENCTIKIKWIRIPE